MYSIFAHDFTDLLSAMLEGQRTNMEATHAEQVSQKSLEKGIIYEIPLSNYAKSQNVFLLLTKHCIWGCR